jgi:hypothetical protein
VTTCPPGVYLGLTMTKPDGTYFWSSSVAVPYLFQLPALPTTGTYALVVSPTGTASASVTLHLYTR